MDELLKAYNLSSVLLLMSTAFGMPTSEKRRAKHVILVGNIWSAEPAGQARSIINIDCAFYRNQGRGVLRREFETRVHEVVNIPAAHRSVKLLILENYSGEAGPLVESDGESTPIEAEEGTGPSQPPRETPKKGKKLMRGPEKVHVSTPTGIQTRSGLIVPPRTEESEE